MMLNMIRARSGFISVLRQYLDGALLFCSGVGNSVMCMSRSGAISPLGGVCRCALTIERAPVFPHPAYIRLAPVLCSAPLFGHAIDMYAGLVNLANPPLLQPLALYRALAPFALQVCKALGEAVQTGTIGADASGLVPQNLALVEEYPKCRRS